MTVGCIEPSVLTPNGEQRIREGKGLARLPGDATFAEAVVLEQHPPTRGKLDGRLPDHRVDAFHAELDNERPVVPHSGVDARACGLKLARSASNTAIGQRDVRCCDDLGGQWRQRSAHIRGYGGRQQEERQ